MRIARETRRILCVLFCLCMALSCMTMTAFAADGDPCGETDCTGTYTNGFCSAKTTHYEPAVLNSQGAYEISNGGQLYWFSKFVDSNSQLAGEDTEDTGDDVYSTSANAVLIRDITVNQNVLVDGELNPDELVVDEFRVWSAIASNKNKYIGTFDGAGFTISGLYYNKDSAAGGYIGLVASLDEGGIVRNVTVADSYICGYRYIGAVVGQNLGGTVENCANMSSVITASSSYIGGVVGGNSGTVTGCTNSGSVSSEEGNNLGGVVGSNSGTVTLCSNIGSVTSECCSDEHCVGGVVGENDEGIILSCYNIGVVTNDGAATGGIVGYSDGGTVENCYNYGTVSGDVYVGGIAGRVVNTPKVKGCYYLAGCASDSKSTIQNGVGNSTKGSVTEDTENATTVMTSEQFASGEVAYLMNGSTSAGDLVWYQTLGTDPSPVFQGGTVYYGYVSCADDAEVGYTNDSSASETKPDHQAAEKSHACGTCGKILSECSDSDTDTDHKCDVCEKVLNECIDENKDHDCDICSNETGEHAAGEGKHTCDYCGEIATECADSDGDYKCDTCGANLGTAPNPECPKDETCVLAQFSDIDPDNCWYHDGVHYCVETGLMKGQGNNSFVPDAFTTRAELVMILYRQAGSPSLDGLTEPFTDVADDAWYYAPIVWAYNKGVVNGTSATTFAPDANITRQDVATILYRYLESPDGTGDLSGFSDAANVWDHAKEAMAWAVGEGLITGDAKDGIILLDPTGNATRAQIAAILHRHLTVE